jgi:DmsE family decaheme c-type cytochrome
MRGIDRRTRHRAQAVAVAAFGVAVCTAALLGLPSGGNTATAQGWTADDCAACHEDVVASFAANPHSVAGEGGTTDCTGCHGDPSEHIAAGGEAGTILGLGEDDPHLQVNERCLSCHGDAHPRFEAGPHARAGMNCSSCHAIHGGGSRPTPGLMKRAELDTSPVTEQPSLASAACIECHADVAAQFKLNERHRLEEGILDCSDCHDPHGPSTRLRLAGFKQEQCLDCHTDKGGPFVFEHGAQKVEGCTACHEPHGSVNRHMLHFQNVAEQCYSCHPGVPQFHLGFNPTAPARFGLDTQCTNCHSTIHGSNLDPAFLK